MVAKIGVVFSWVTCRFNLAEMCILANCKMENHKLNQTINKLILNLMRNLNGSNDEYIQRSIEHFIYSIIRVDCY